MKIFSESAHRFLKSSLERTIMAVGVVGLAMSSAHAADSILQWKTTNVQVLHGEDYKLGAKERTIFTLEHANGFKYGDNYFFMDYTKDQNATYGEWTPRLSLSKMTGADLSFGPIKDISLAGVIEFPSGMDIRDGYGIGIDWKVPGFQYVKTNILNRDDPRFDGRAGLVTLAWGANWHLGEVPVRFEGYCDFQEAEGSWNSWTNCAPRLFLDVGYFAGNKGHFFAGFEYQYWDKKFGVDGVKEDVLQLDFKVVF